MYVSIHYHAFQALAAHCDNRDELEQQFQAIKQAALTAWENRVYSGSRCRFLQPITINGERIFKRFTVWLHRSHCLIVA